MTCPINPTTTPYQCGARYSRAQEYPNNKEYSICLQCGEGENNIEAYRKEHERLNKTGVCDNCGTEGWAQGMVIDGKTWHLCGVCYLGAKKARKAGAKWEDAKDEVKERALGKIIKSKKHTYSFERREKQLGYGKGKCGICGLEMSLSYKLKDDGRTVCMWCHSKRRSAITAGVDLKAAEKEIAEAHALVVHGKGVGPLSWEREKAKRSAEKRKEAEKNGLGKVKKSPKPEQSITKQEQYKIGAEYQDNKAAKITYEPLEIIPVPECLQKPWIDPSIPEFLKADEKLLELVVSRADANRQTVIGYILSVLEAA